MFIIYVDSYTVSCACIVNCMVLFQLSCTLYYYCSVGLPACSVTVNVTAVTSTSITVRLVWINCAGAEPSSILLMWSSLDDFGSTASRDINTQTEITGLKPNTNYNITATFSDACGSISDVVVAATLTQLGK